MTTYSPVHSVKSNARRSAKKLGLNPDTVVACAGGFHFPVEGGAAAKPAKPKAAPKAKAGKTKAAGKKPKREGKTGGLLETVLSMITAKGGATMPEIMKATGWLAHTARARISGIVKANKLEVERQRLLGVTTYIATSK